jgi:glycine/D-amino acid oxidase-like deaminating enzyme
VETVDVLVIGAGIAGRTAAYFAKKRGRRVTIVDAGLPATSDVPVALVNPLRGATGRLVPHGIAGMRATLALVDALRERGHPVVAGRGVHRPIITTAAQLRQQAYWEARLNEQLAFDWHAVAPRELGLAEPVPSLFLRDAGWVEPASLLAALAEETGAERIAGRVSSMTGCKRATLADGTTIAADTILWCAGSSGAAQLDAVVDPALRDGVYKPGSLVIARAALTHAPLSFGLYALPAPGRPDETIVGPTREDAVAWPDGTPLEPRTVRLLEDRVARTFGQQVSLAPLWRGTRLARLSTPATAALRGIAALTGLGSRGFLMAPLLAEGWSRSL